MRAYISPNNTASGPKYYNMNGIWALKPYHLGPCTFRDGHGAPAMKGGRSCTVHGFRACHAGRRTKKEKEWLSRNPRVGGPPSPAIVV